MAGRPPGAKNKKGMLIAWAGGERDPALFLAEVMVNQGEDPNRRTQAAVALLPYVHRKLPMAVEADINATGSFTLEIRRYGDEPAKPAG
jgi:hypothetical protein